MPTYGYRCTVNGHEFERVQKMTDPALTACDICGAPVKKILYPVGIQFKGDGFYVNDYAKTPPPKEDSGANNDKGDKGETAKPADTSSTTDTSPKTGDTKTDSTPVAPVPVTPAAKSEGSSSATH